MERHGVHPDVQGEIDVVKIVRALAHNAERVATQVEKGFDADVSTDWREYAKRLASRVRAQRGEIDRLHKKVRELRADVHEITERAQAAEADVRVARQDRASVAAPRVSEALRIITDARKEQA